VVFAGCSYQAVGPVLLKSHVLVQLVVTLFLPILPNLADAVNESTLMGNPYLESASCSCEHAFVGS
jgi:hypothetical protein